LPQNSNELGRYGKLAGLLKAASIGLPVARKGYVIESEDDDLSELVADKDFSVSMCRPDAPTGFGNDLPRGRDLEADKILPFLSEIRSKNGRAVLLVLKTPSVEATGRYIPRYEISGACMAMVSMGDSIKFDYVGRGFDVGEITRGKAAHYSIVVPWEMRHEKEASIMWQSRAFHLHHQIDAATYDLLRKERIDELENNLGANGFPENSIPPEIEPFDLDKFRKFNRIVRSALCSTKLSDNDFGIMMNLYDNEVYVFEIWHPSRSTPTRSIIKS